MSAGNPYPSNKSNSGMDDDDGRTRNAKAQRRHREKRKAHLKTLEESVQLLTNQLEDARRQLSSAAYANRMSTGGSGGPPLSPGGSKDYMALQQENTYLREENAELRRQMYNYSVNRNYPHGEGEAKQEAYGSYGQPSGQNGAPGQLASPREGSNGGRDGQVPANNDNFTPLSRGSRSRVMSSSSAPAASPYPPPTSAFPTDPRAHALAGSSGQAERYPPVRYDNIYGGTGASGSGGGGGGGSGSAGGGGGGGGSATHSPNMNASASHNLPRSGLGYDHLDMYSNRDEQNWGPDAGPPPFQGSVYPVPYGDGPSDEWRGEGHSH